MTQEALDLLDRLSNPDNIKQAESDKSRPGWRPALQHFKADILGSAQDIQIETRRPVGSNYDDTGYWLDIDVREILHGRGEMGEQKLWIKFPRFPSGDYPDKDSDSENARMMLAAREADPTITSPRQLPGRRNVEFKEETYDYTYYSKAKGGEVPATTYFYRLNFSGAAASNRAAMQSLPTEEATEKAISLLTEGMDEKAFGLAAMKDPLIKKDSALISAIASGKFATEQIAGGRVVRDGSNLVAV